MGREIRVFGPPGTGKTTYLANQINRAVNRLKTTRILVASFTRTAAKELAGRDVKIKRGRIGTLHSMAYRALGYPEVAESEKWLERWNDQHKPEEQISVSSFDPEHGGAIEFEGRTKSDRRLFLYNWMRAKGLSLDEVKDDIRGEIEEFVSEWEDFKHQYDLIDFTDMIYHALHDLSGPPYESDVGFFDEVQDFSPLELALVRKWGKTFEYTILAGDDDQCIYSYKGASPEAFLMPEIPEEDNIILPKSYRLPERIKRAAEEYIKGVMLRKQKEFESKGPGGEIELDAPSWAEPFKVVSWIERELKNHSSVMLLASCNFMLGPVLKALRSHGIAFHNPYRPENGYWNAGTSAKRRMAAYLTEDVELYGMLTKPHTWGSIWEWIEVLDAKKIGLKRGAKKYIESMAKEKTTAEEELKESDWQEIGIKPPDGSVEWFWNNLRPSKKNMFVQVYTMVKYGQLRSLREPPKLIVGTIHSVKGGEADVVYVFPDISSSAVHEILLRGADAIDAVKRMFYVAITRARKKLIIAKGHPDRNLRAEYLLSEFREVA